MPPDRFEVDLTSVCVRRGTVQLPYRLQGAFHEGPIAAVDADGGALLDLAFRPPRELVGLRPFFEAHALRANDRIGLVFTDGGLRVEAVKREHRSTGRVAGASAGIGVRPNEPQAAASPPPGASRGRGAERRRDAGPAAPPASERESGYRSAAPSVPPTLRMAVPTASVPAEGHDAKAATTEPARAPHWEPLDITAGKTVTESARVPAPVRVEVDEPTPSVRAVRRVPTAEPEAPTEHGTWSQASEPAPPTTPRRSTSEREEGERAPKPLQGRGLDLFGLRRRLGIGRGTPTRQVDPTPADDRPRSSTPSGPPWPAAPRADASSRTSPTSPGSAMRDEAPAATAAEPTAQLVVEHTEQIGPVEAAPTDEDIAAVLAHLARPGTPAIVRAERVAEALGMSVTRADRALDRISEDSEQLSRIRARAYMVRRRGDR